MTAADGPVMNLLWSYVYARKFEMDKFLGELPVPRLRFFADSGAHSARTLGIDLQIADYVAWVHKWQPWFTIYANLDVIGAPEATWRNQQYMEDQGLHPMPVFHTGEPFSVLERYLDAGYTYIALGKLLGNATKDLRPWLAKAFRIAHGRAVFHGFGLTVWPLLTEFPFYSVDSSTWVSGVRYGYLRLFHRGQWAKLWLRSRRDILANRAVLDAYRLPYSALSRSGYDRKIVSAACAVAVYRANAWLRDRHGPIELPPGKGYPPHPTHPPKIVGAGRGGLNTYLAESARTGHRRHADGLHVYLADASVRWTANAALGIGREVP